MKFSEFLEEKAKEYSKVVQDFPKALAIYEGESDEQINKACLEAYDKAVDAAMEWLKLAVKVNLLEAEYDRSFVALHLPDGELHVDVTVQADKFPDAESVADPEKCYLEGKDMAVTAIGEMDIKMLDKIFNIQDNPVILLYRHFGNLLHRVHSMTNGIVTEEFLAEQGIQDVLNVHKIDQLLDFIDKFFMY